MSGRSKYEIARAILVASGGTPKPADSFYNFLEKWLVQEGGTPKPCDSVNDLLRKLCVARGETPHPIDSNNDLLRRMSGLGAGCMNTEHLEAILALVSGGGPVPLPPPPVAPEALEPSEFSDFEVKARWSHPSPAGLTFRLDVSTASDFSSFVPGYQNKNVGTLTESVVGPISESVLYYYRVRAVGPGGTSANSNTIFQRTLPAAPTGFAAVSPAGATSMSFVWEDNSSGEVGYRLYGFITDIESESTVQATLGANVTSSGVILHNGAGFEEDGDYTYRLVAYNDVGESESVEINFAFTPFGEY